MFGTVNNKLILPFKLNTTLGAFLLSGDDFSDFEAKFAESFFLKSIIYYSAIVGQIMRQIY
jgi:hypothetical protein